MYDTMWHHLQEIGLFTLLSADGKAMEVGDGGLVVAAAPGQQLEEQEQEPADIIMVRWYDSPEDERSNPLAMRPLVWRSSTSGRSTGSSYGVELASTVAMRICVVPDYKRGEGNFLINDLAYLPSEDMLPVVKEEDVSQLDSTAGCHCMDM
jgi:hypothetical protein